MQRHAPPEILFTCFLTIPLLSEIYKPLFRACTLSAYYQASPIMVLGVQVLIGVKSFMIFTFPKGKIGWFTAKVVRRSVDCELRDDRILDSGKFVGRIIKEAEAKIKFKLPVKKHHQKIDECLAQKSKNEKVSIEELKTG
jgi:hypothetical protein